MTKPVIAGIGEILFDILGDTEELGGAPVNFAYHVSKLGAVGYAISAVGNDERGDRALAELSRRQLSTEYICRLNGYETGYVRASLDENGIADYEFPDNIAWDNLVLRESTLTLAQTLAAVCYGSLAQRAEKTRNALLQFLKATPASTLKVFDLNLRGDFYNKEIVVNSLEHADILKLSDEELPTLCEMLAIKGDELVALRRVQARFELQLAALTRGGNGSLLVTGEEVSDHRGIQAEKIIDTIGAGDAFTAAIVISLLKGEDLDTISDKANRLAAWVCSQKGAMPPYPKGDSI